MSDSFSEKLQAQIVEEHNRLTAEAARLKEELAKIHQELEALKNHCGHPNAIRGLRDAPYTFMNPIKTISCPDCGYNVMIWDLSDKEPIRRRGRPSKRSTE